MVEAGAGEGKRHGSGKGGVLEEDVGLQEALAAFDFGAEGDGRKLALVEPGDDFAGQRLAAVKFLKAHFGDDVTGLRQGAGATFERLQFVALHVEFDEAGRAAGLLQDGVQCGHGHGEAVCFLHLEVAPGDVGRRQEAGGVGTVGAVQCVRARGGANSGLNEGEGLQPFGEGADVGGVFGQRLDADNGRGGQQ